MIGGFINLRRKRKQLGTGAEKNRCRLGIELLEDRCLPSTVGAPGMGLRLNSFIFADNVSPPTAVYMVTTAHAQAAIVPTTPTGTAPLGDVQNAEPIFTWTPVANAVSYGVRVDDETAGGTQVLTKSNLAGAHWTAATALVAGHEYTWSVRAVGQNASVSAWSQPYAFTVVPLNMPIPQVPAGTIESTTPTFQWAGSANADLYSFSLKDVTSTHPKAVASIHVSAMSWTPTVPLVLGHVYQWSVEALSKNGDHSVWSSPTTITLISPFTGLYTGQFAGTQSNTFAFTVAANGKISVAQPLNGHGSIDLYGNIVLTISGIGTGKTAASFRGTIDVSGGKASVSGGTWTVGKSGHGTWTSTASQLTGATLNTPTMLMPNGFIANRQPSLSWNKVNGAVSYMVTVTDTTTKARVLSTHVSATFVIATNPFRLGHSYQWVVQALGPAGGASGWSSAHFTVVSASLSRSTLSVPSVTLKAGDTITITLQTKDAAGNNITDGGLTVAFDLGGGTGSGTFSSVTDHGNGLYTSTFEATTAGKNTIAATISKKMLSAAPTAITVNPGSVSLSESIVSVSPSSIQSGSNTTVELITQDAFGNRARGGGLTVAFGLGAGVASGTFSDFADNQDGTYTEVFTGSTAGQNSITASVGGRLVASTPAITVTPGPLSLSQSVVSLSTSSITLNGTALVTLHVKDANGNNLTGGGLTVTFGLGSGSGSGTFAPISPTDNLNGTYTATFTPTTGGTDTFTAAIGGQPVTSTAPGLTVTALGTPAVVGPAGSTPSWAPTFSWNAVSGATSYEFKLDDMTSGQTQVFDQDVTGTSFDPFYDVVTFTPIPDTSSMSSVNFTYNSESAGLATTDSAGHLVVTAGQLQAFLSNLAGNVSVTGNQGGPFTVVFANGLDPSDLTAGAYARVVPSTPLTQGDQYRWYVRALSANNSSPWTQQDFNIPASPYMGTYKGTYSGYLTATFTDQLTFNSSGVSVTFSYGGTPANTTFTYIATNASNPFPLQTYLNKLPGINGNVEVTDNLHGSFTISFLNGIDPTLLSVSTGAQLVTPAAFFVQGAIVLTVDGAGNVSVSQPGADGRGSALNGSPARINPEGLLPVYNGTSDVGGPLAGLPVNSTNIGGDDSITGVAGGIIGTAVLLPGGQTQTYLFAGPGRDDISIGATFRDIQFGSSVSGVWIATATGGTAPPDALDTSGFNPIVNTWRVSRQ